MKRVEPNIWLLIIAAVLTLNHLNWSVQYYNLAALSCEPGPTSTPVIDIAQEKTIEGEG